MRTLPTLDGGAVGGSFIAQIGKLITIVTALKGWHVICQAERTIYMLLIQEEKRLRNREWMREKKTHFQKEVGKKVTVAVSTGIKSSLWYERLSFLNDLLFSIVSLPF